MMFGRKLRLFWVLVVAPGLCRAFGQDLNKLKERWNAPTSGSSLEMKEVKRAKIGQVTGIAFGLLAHGLPEQNKYDFWIWPSGKDPIRVDSVQFDSTGTVLQVSDRQPATLWFVGVSKGETTRAALISDNQQFIVSAKKIPFPIEVTSGTCHVALEQVILGRAFAAYGTGFAPGEDVSVTCPCKQNNVPAQIKAEPQGAWTTILTAVEEGKDSGTTSLQLVGRNCKLAIDLPWGKAALKYE